MVLWVAVIASALGLFAVKRGLDREARATAREKAFLANVTHELRTPLTSIRAFAELMRERLHWPSVEVPQRGDCVHLV